MCYTLLYMSVAGVRPSQGDLTRLLSQGRAFNATHAVTGVLVYANGHWMEVLEGERQTIEDLMARIALDPRHHDIEVIEKGETTAREFTDWSMAFLDFATPEVRALPGYSTFLEEPLELETPGQAGRGREMLNYFKAIMLASDDSITNLAQAAEIRQRAPVLAGKIAAARRQS